MKKLYKRWYEQDEYLKAFMGLLEKLSLEKQCEIAVDIIIQASSMTDREYSKIVADVGDYDPRDYKRWYDKNPNLHTAIESLRELNDEQREEIIKTYTDKILRLHNYKLEGLED